MQESINTRHGVERIVRYAFDLAMQPHRRKKLTLVHKTNVLTFAGDLYQRVVDEVAAEFPEVETDYVHVDAACIYFLDWPARFDVIVTDNMFGDIITDLGAMIQGGMGIAAGGNINPTGVSMFEPIGGTAPDHTGKGTINPLAAIGAMEMLLRQLGEDDAAARVDRGIRARHRPDEEHARRRDGHHHGRGRRPRRAGCERMTTEAAGAALQVELYDTTLRDGAQGTGFSYSIEDRLRILHKLDQLGVPFIEGGWPGANPRDTEFFKLATKETLRTSTLTAFGMTRKAGERAEDSARCCATCSTPAPRSCAWWASRGTCTSPRRSAPTSTRASRWCATRSRSCGTRAGACSSTPSTSSTGTGADPAFAMRVLAAAEEAGAERLVLCDTNGGMLPFDVARIVDEVRGTHRDRRSGSTCTTTPAARSRTR